MNNEFKVIKRVTGNGKYNCEMIDLSKPYDYTKPIVMCFTGNSGNKLEFANGFAKAIGNTAKIENEVELVSVKYREKHSVGVFEPKDVEDFVDCFFLPLLQKNGKRLSIEQVKKNLRKITIVTHCYGAEFVRYLNHVLQDRMFKLGFKEDKVLSILKYLIHIGYAPYTESNYNTNFYFKSVDDKTFWGKTHDMLGEKYTDDAKCFIESLPPKERKKYFVKGKMYLANGLIENNGNFNIYFENLTGSILKRNDDHRAGTVLKDNKGGFLVDDENIHSYTASKCFRYILQEVIKNSVENENGNVDLDIIQIEEKCTSFIETANESETEQIKRQVLENSLEHITPEEALKRMRVTEKDFLLGNINMDKINNAILGVVDWGDCIYTKTKWVFCNPSVCFREYDKDNIKCTELTEHKEGIILNSGELVILSNNKDDIFYQNLALLINKRKLEGSIKYRIMRKNGKYFIALSDNYGSRELEVKEDFESQIKYWQKEYKQDKLTMDLTEKQKITLKNLCVFFDIENNNIKFKKDTGVTV